MAHAYTPGLKVSRYTIIRKDRRLPLKGEVLVEEGQKVKAEDIVARTQIPGNVVLINVAAKLGIDPSEVRKVMLKKEGDPVKKDEVIAFAKVFFGLFKTELKSPIDGIVESISDITGQVILREPPINVEINAFIDGTVVKVYPQEGVEIETTGAFIQGIFGVGGERIGKLRVAVDSPEEELTVDRLLDDESGNIIVGGSFVTGEALLEAQRRGAYGVIVGGIDDINLKEYVGYDIGVAITGNEDVDTTLIITEGFGKIRMATRTFDILKSLEGYKTSISGATQIRAGVMRPEIIIPYQSDLPLQTEEDEGTLEIGRAVRIIRSPYFGLIGKVVELPPQPTKIETESTTRVLKVQLEDGRIITVPRANVELIQE